MMIRCYTEVLLRIAAIHADLSIGGGFAVQLHVSLHDIFNAGMVGNAQALQEPWSC
jgi:hypothetical protein